MKKVVVRHFHDGNDQDRSVRGNLPGKKAIYATRARVVDLDTGDTLAEEWSYCNPVDVPSRKIGRFKAVRRLQGRYPTIVEGAEYGIGLEYLKET